MTQIADIADAYVSALAALHPNLATSLGLPGAETRLTDFSPDGCDARAALREATRRDLERAQPEHDRERVARDVMLERFDAERESHESDDHLRALNIIASPFQSTRSVFDLMPRDTDQHWSQIAERMRAVPQALDQYRASLAAGLDADLSAAQRQVRGLVEQSRVWTASDGFFHNLAAEGAQQHPTLQNDLDAGARDAASAYGQLADWLNNTYLPRATERDPVGPDRYRRAARDFNGLILDLEETYQWGWEELWRIQSEMRQTAERIQPGATVAQAIEILETDDERAIEGEDAFRQWMQTTQDDTIASMHGVHFDIAEPIRRIEAMIAPPGGALAMYYTGPSEDFARPGRTWYPTGGATRFPLWRELSVCYHEGVPGHHLQIGTTRWLGDKLNRYQRLLAGTSGYVEGWALYAERLMHELGYLEDPAYYMGLLSSQALRAARVVVDIGMHLELPIPQQEQYHAGQTWRPELALPFLEQRSFFPKNMLASEVDRYLGWPGQAISYKVGERQWLNARESTKAAQGDAFDLKQFHQATLEKGPMGLAQLTRETAQKA